MLFITFRQKLSTRGDTDGKGVLFRHILKKIVHTLFWIVRYVDLKLQELRGSDTIKKSMVKSMVERQSVVIQIKVEKSVAIIALL